MARKYQVLDRKLFAWLRLNRSGATTASAVADLSVTSKTHQRHISRRFTQLEDKGVLRCTLRGTTRVCEVVAEIPVTMSKQHWRDSVSRSVARHMHATGQRPGPAPTPQPSLRAANSDEFLAAGGTIERLDSRWDTPRIGSKPLGPSFFDDFD